MKKVKQKTALRMQQYRTMKILKMMKSILKKTKARGVFVQFNYLKKLKKLRKWMDILNPTLKLNMEDNFRYI